MPMNFSTTVIDAVTQHIADEMNAELGAAAVCEFFDGAMPANCAAADAGTLIATVALPSTVWGAASGNVFQNLSISAGSVSVTGTVQYFRMKDSGGTCVLQGTCSGGPPASIIFNTDAWTATDTLQIDFIIFTVFMVTLP